MPSVLSAVKLAIHSSLDLRPRSAETEVQFDGNTGELRHFRPSASEPTANTAANWLFALHMAQVGGLPYRIFVALLGLLIPALALSGIWIWWRKRTQRNRAKT